MERQVFMDAVTRHQDMVYRIALHWFGVPQDAEDAVQEVFLRLYTEEKTFDGPEHLRRWLLRVTVNVCKDALKSPWRKRRMHWMRFIRASCCRRCASWSRRREKRKKWRLKRT